MFGNKSNATDSSIKYGDADVSSKRRKLPQTEESNNHDYQRFEKIAINNQLNSSFREISSMDSLDFKGGLLCDDSNTPTNQTPTKSTLAVENDTTAYSLLSVINTDSNQICAKNDLTVTTKPSMGSKHYENSFKMLESQLEVNRLKNEPILQTLKSKDNTSFLRSLSVVSECEEPLPRLDLELDARHRLNALLNQIEGKRETQHVKKISNSLDVNKTFLTLLHDFIYHGQKEKNKIANQNSGQELEYNSDIIYHAAKDFDGNKRLRIVRGSSAKVKVLCGNRVSQMTRAYDDIEAVTRLLEEKEKDLELTVQIGKELLTQNNTLENKINDLETDLKAANDDRAQLVHELNKKNELIAVLTNDADDGSEAGTPTLSKSITLDLLQKKITSLQDENQSLKVEASQLANETDAVEAHERQLMHDITTQLNEANEQFENLSLELERQREENRLQYEQIVSLTARLSEAEMRLHQLTHDNDEHITLLNITKENQNSLAMELVEFKQRYQEVLSLLQETQEQLRKQRKKSMPQARSSFMSNMGMLQPESLHSELMESSLYSENSLDSGISGDNARSNDRISRLISQVPGMCTSMTEANSSSMMLNSGCVVPPYKRVFETVRCASKNGNNADSVTTSITQLGAMSMSNSTGPRMSAIPYNGSVPAGSFHRQSGYDAVSMGVKTLSLESLNSQSDDGYPSQPSGVPGAPGAKDLEAALKRLTPAEVLARRAMLSFAPAGTYSYDEQPQMAQVLGIRTPDSIMSTGSSGISSSMNVSLSQWRLPEKLQIVKPMEGSQTLHHWSRLATPTLSGLLEERPGVTIRGGRGLDDLGMQVYNLSDVEEDISEELPGKQFEASGCTYTFTMSNVMHPDDGIVNDLSFLSQSQMSSRMASASTSRNPSCPPTPHAGLSRKNSCSTFSVNLGLASLLNERGIKAVTPSALNTPAGPNFSPTVTPCNSPEGSPTRTMSPEPLFGLLSSGAELIRRKLVGGEIERPNRNQQKQKIMLSRLERRALRSLKLVEKVESIGLENIIASQPNAMSQLASGIASRSLSPMAQLTSLKNLHTNSNNIVDDIRFDRAQIKDVLHKGLKSPMEAARLASDSVSSVSTAYNSDNDDDTLASCSRNEVNRKSAVSLNDAQNSNTSTNATATATPIPSLHFQAKKSQKSLNDARAKHVQRQKSRRNLKNGIATQRPDLGTIGGRMRNDLGKVSIAKNEAATGSGKDKFEKSFSNGSSDKNAQTTPKETTQSLTQAFVGTVSSLLFGRKGGWL